MLIVPNNQDKSKQEVNALGEQARRPLDAHLWTREAVVRWKAAGYPPAREFEAVLRRDSR
jgi:hypothetical protein